MLKKKQQQQEGKYLDTDKFVIFIFSYPK
jgi:hypothetical protein